MGEEDLFEVELSSRGSGTSTCVNVVVGLKVTGGKMTPAGRLGAFITKVKRGSIADVVGQLKSGTYLRPASGRQTSPPMPPPDELDETYASSLIEDIGSILSIIWKHDVRGGPSHGHG